MIPVDEYNQLRDSMKRKNIDPTCTSCGGDKRQMLDSYASFHQSEGATFNMGEVVNMVACICSNCGKVTFYYPEKLLE